MRQYVLAVICACLICGTALCLVREGTARAAVKLLCGILLAITVAAPLGTVEFDQVLTLPDSLDADGLTAAGEEMARDSMAAIIKDSCETYIMDKATALQGKVQADIALSDEAIPVPASVKLSGEISSAGKSQLETMIQRDLGIPKENLRWTG